MTTPPSSPPLELRIQAVCMLVLTALAISAALYLFRSVLLPFVLAILLTYCVAPIIGVQTTYLRFPRSMALVTTILLASAVVFLLGLLFAAAAGEVGAHADDYQRQITQLVRRVAAWPGFERVGLNTEVEGGMLLNTLGKSAAGAFRGTVSGIMSIVSNGMLVLIFMIFMLAGRTDKAAAGSVLFEIEANMKRYILAMVFVSAITGVLVGATLAILGVPLAWMFGFLAFLLNFIPNIGSVIATLLPLPVVLLSPDLSLTVQILAIAIPGTIQFVVGNVMAPRIMGRSLDLHPVVVLMSLIFFGIVWGIVGMFLATPLVAIVKILLMRFEYTRPVGALLGGHLGRLAEPAPPKPAGLT